MNDEQIKDTEMVESDDAVIGKAFRWSLIVIVIVGAGIGFGVWWTNREAPPPPVENGHVAPPKIRDKPKLEIPEIRFTDITSEAGITFVHHNGATGEKMLPETMGGGCAFFDFDNDGDQDLLLVNSCEWPWSERDLAEQPVTQLYRNDGAGQFENVSKGSGLDVTMYGMGVAVGDYDNDGLVDVFISGVGSNRLFHNEGDGAFTEVTGLAGVAGSEDQWSTSCGFFDYDNDGDLDLFVCNYVKWSRGIDLAQGFSLTGIGRAYGPPTAFGGTHPYLYQNNGDGTFADVSQSAGVQVSNPTTGVPMAKSMGVTMVDLDGDALLDVIVSNDTVRNFVFHNQGDGTFEEVGIDAGVAFDSAGKARAGMGIDVANYRNSKALGVAIGNFANEMTAFYVADNKPMRFTDDAVPSGLGPPSRLALTFGLFFADCDLDGRLDLVATNGHLEEDINKVQSSQQYRQPAHLYWNCGAEQDAEYCPLPKEKLGQEFRKPLVGRGASYADIDGDGDLDVLFTQVNGPPLLLRNEQSSGHNWFRLKLVGKRCNRDAIGAVITLVVKGQTIRRIVAPTQSYLSQVELPITIGIGQAKSVERLEISWPTGARQTPEITRLNETVQITQN